MFFYKKIQRFKGLAVQGLNQQRLVPAGKGHILARLPHGWNSPNDILFLSLHHVWQNCVFVLKSRPN